VRQLDRLYPGLKQERLTLGPTSTISAPVEGLDLSTVIRVSQAISGEMLLERLLHSVMRKAMEHAGAERSLLIAPRGDELKIEAESETRGNEVIVHLGDASAVAAALPWAIVRYVMRTHESVIIDDALSPNPFSADPYILQNRVRSILCLPLINQAKVNGILYFENNLTPQVFTAERVTVLKLLTRRRQPRWRTRGFIEISQTAKGRFDVWSTPTSSGFSSLTSKVEFLRLMTRFFE
jgi:transcriptional regulator with GAF, ATPase, and Fis domain